MIDWIEGFEKKFSEHSVISELRRLKFHGKLEVNFADGEPNTVHINWCVRPYTSATLKEGGING